MMMVLTILAMMMMTYLKTRLLNISDDNGDGDYSHDRNDEIKTWRLMIAGDNDPAGVSRLESSHWQSQVWRGCGKSVPTGTWYFHDNDDDNDVDGDG